MQREARSGMHKARHACRLWTESERCGEPQLMGGTRERRGHKPGSKVAALAHPPSGAPPGAPEAGGQAVGPLQAALSGGAVQPRALHQPGPVVLSEAGRQLAHHCTSTAAQRGVGGGRRIGRPAAGAGAAAAQAICAAGGRRQRSRAATLLSRCTRAGMEASAAAGQAFPHSTLQPPQGCNGPSGPVWARCASRRCCGQAMPGAGEGPQATRALPPSG